MTSAEGFAPTVDVVIDDPRWHETDLLDRASEAVGLALSFAGIAMREVEVAILASTDAHVSTLNAQFRGKSGATNVLSWPALDLFPEAPGAPPGTDIPSDPHGATSLGDIALAYETVAAEATAAQIPLNAHISHLILHACLHLLGYDHQTEADARRMEDLEVQALASIGIASPYRDH